MAMERSSGLVIKNAAQLVTSSSRGSPRRGKEMAQLTILVDAAIVIDNSIITWVGPTAELPAVTESALVIDATGKTVLSGLVDSHTHLVWAGTREGEFEQRLQGRTYQEISAAGGGINATVASVRCLGAARATVDVGIVGGQRQPVAEGIGRPGLLEGVIGIGDGWPAAAEGQCAAHKGAELIELVGGVQLAGGGIHEIVGVQFVGIAVVGIRTRCL
jgi:imidazolonepropionase-like amidohydrolase